MKKYVIVLVMLIGVYITGCSPIKDEIELYEVETVRREIKNNLHEIYEKDYKNIEFGNFIIQFPESENEMYKIKLEKKENVCGKDIVDRVNEQVKILLKYMGTNVSKKDIQIFITSKNDTNMTFKYSEDSIKELENSSKKEKLKLVLYDKMEKNEKYMQFSPNYSLVWMSSGGMLKETGTSISKVFAIAQGDYSDVKTYYRNMGDDSLEDIYKFADGKMSVQQAIQKVEKFLNNNTIMNKNTDVIMVVDKIYVFPLNNGNVGMYFTYRKKYNEINFDTWHDGRIITDGDMEENVIYDVAGISLYKTKQIDFFFGSNNRASVEKVGESIKNIVPLSTACQLVDEFVTETIKVNSIELTYRVRGNEKLSYGTPVWKFEVESKNSKINYKIYVNITDGSIEFVQL